MLKELTLGSYMSVLLRSKIFKADACMKRIPHDFTPGYSFAGALFTLSAAYSLVVHSLYCKETLCVFSVLNGGHICLRHVVGIKVHSSGCVVLYSVFYIFVWSLAMRCIPPSIFGHK